MSKTLCGGAFKTRDRAFACVVAAVAVMFAAVSCSPRLSVGQDPEGGGIVVPAARRNVAAKKPFHITAVPAKDHRFVSWTAEDGDITIANADSASTTVILRTDAEVTAKFERLYALTVNRNLVGGNVTVSDRHAVAAGMPVGIQAFTADGYRFVNWTVHGGRAQIADANDPNTVVTLNADATVTANYLRILKLTVDRNQTAGGTVSADSTQAVIARAPVGITAVADSGYKFINWTAASGRARIADADSASTTVWLSSDAVVTANFQRILRLGEQFNPNAAYSVFIDQRDGRHYRTIEAGRLVWMAENLDYGTSGGESAVDNVNIGDTARIGADSNAVGKVVNDSGAAASADANQNINTDSTVTATNTFDSGCYDDEPYNCAMYGRLYDWAAASAACPDGWRLPDSSDWLDLILTAGGGDIAGKNLRAVVGWNNRADGANGNGIDHFGFAALPGGARGVGAGGGFDGGIGRSGRWWSSSPDYNQQAFGVSINSNSDSAGYHSFNRYVCMSVRCVKDSERGTSVAVLAPRAEGLGEDLSYLPALIQSELLSAFSNHSGISVLGWERLEGAHPQLFSAYYDASARHNLGSLTPTTHILGGKITKNAAGYHVQIDITGTSDKTVAASYSGTFTIDELNSLTGIRRASLELLRKMGVTVTEEAQGGLAEATAGAANAAFAKGVTAQRLGADITALGYFMQAAAFDSTLSEAARRTLALSANVTSGSIAAADNDAARRERWAGLLAETERFFDNFNRNEAKLRPYTLYYSNDIARGEADTQKGTVTLSIETRLEGTDIWLRPMLALVTAVRDGLRATGRAGAWELNKWPHNSVSGLRPFGGWNDQFAVVFELLNDQNKVIAAQTLTASGQWSLGGGESEDSALRVNRYIGVGWRSFSGSSAQITVDFLDVNAGDITDNMTVRIASVNGANAETAVRNGVLRIETTARKEAGDGN